MTHLEKALEIHKEEGDKISSDWIINNLCPYDYELDEFKECRKNEFDKERCKACWEREMPNTEPKADKSFTVQSAYRKGKKDAWELANNIYTMSDKEFDDVFGYVHKEDIFCYLNYDEALAKMKAYEEAQIEVGDVVWVKELEQNAVVTYEIIPKVYVLMYKDGEISRSGIDDFKKTGKHIDIQSILEQIGE